MQARTIILADHSGTAQAETHSRRFYISGHCGGISSVTCCLWLVNTQCVFSPGMPNKRGGGGGGEENISTLHGHETCAWRSTLFSLAKPGEGGQEGCSLNWEELFVWFDKQIIKMWLKGKTNQKRMARPAVHMENGGAQTKRCGLLHHFKVGGRGGGRGGASSKRGGWNSQGNGKQIQPVVCSVTPNFLFAMAMQERCCFQIKNIWRCELDAQCKPSVVNNMWVTLSCQCLHKNVWRHYLKRNGIRLQWHYISVSV